MKQLLFVLFFLATIVGYSQLKSVDGSFSGTNGVISQDSISNEIKVKLSGKTKYTDYKIISRKGDTTIVDTTLTIQKEYKFNFRRKDNFELLEFHNQGQTFTNLAYDYNGISLFPDIGYRAKQHLYMNVDDIDYYEVPTPTSEILYRTGLLQGQVLDALFTLNFSKRLNVSIAYKGLRSLGQYRQSLSSTGNFRTTISYSTPKDQYRIKAHATFQDFWNEENGGLSETMVEAFETNYEKKDFNFTQSSNTTDIFGDSYASTNISEGAESLLTNNQGYLEFNSKYILGRFKAKANFSTINYGYDHIYNPTVELDKIRLKGNAVSVGAEWKGKVGNFHVNADGNLTPGQGYLAGNYLKGEALYKKDSLFTVKGSLLINSKAPNFNFQLHHSNYDAYNWSNNFDNINTRNLGFEATSKWGNASLNFTNIEDYTYFDTANTPQQHDGSIAYLKLKVNKEFKYGKFALDNTLMYQNVSSGSEVFRVPDFVTRNTVYYSDHWFKGDPLQVQIGATFKYFTKYSANAYNPLLAEFTLQNDTEIGYPTFDVFFNARVRRTRIFFKVDNVTSEFTSSSNYYSAPNYPYRDFVVRFGLVWNWFI